MRLRGSAIRQAAAFAVVLALATAARPSARPRHDDDREDSGHATRVLLISIDGMHALDYENCVNAGTCPHLAALGLTGVTYTRTSSSKPSDSFPGLMALVTVARRRPWARITTSPMIVCWRRQPSTPAMDSRGAPVSPVK